ncbi:MAG: hypothetical protein V1885_01590 [Candidatus Brennerbacteria bacterium]
MKGHAVFHENLADREVIIGIAGEPIHAKHHKNLNTALVFTAEFQSPQKLFAIMHAQVLGALALFAEHFQDLDAFFLAVFTAMLFLGFKRGALYLLVARNSYVNNSFHDFLCISMR